VPAYYVLFIPPLFSGVNIAILVIQLQHRYKISLLSVITFHLKLKDLKRIYKKLWVFGSMTLLTSIAGNVDPIILKALGFTEKDFGILGVAKKLINAANMGGSAILHVLFPRLSKDYFDSREVFTNTFQKVFKPLIIINLLTLSFLVLFGDLLIPFLFGAEYIQSVKYMYLFSMGFLTPTLMFLSSALIAANAEKKVLFSNIIFLSLIPLAKYIGVSLSDKYAIGYVDAIHPYLSIIVFFVLLHQYFRPSLSVTFYAKTILLVGGTLAIILFLPLIGLENYMAFIAVALYLAFFVFVLSYANFGELIKIKKILNKKGSDNTSENDL
jgi:O-antigen/teichoic acid export membrane protein